jgi:hypothetical protein
MNKIEKLKSNYFSLIDNIYQTHEYLNIHAVKSVNICLTLRNFLFGYYLVEYEQKGSDRSKYGEKLLENVSKSLSARGLKNVSAAELSRFRQFYSVYPQIFGTMSQKSFKLPEKIFGMLSQELQTTDYISVDPVKLVTHIPFSHIVELIKIDDPRKRLFYEIETIKGSWSVRELRRQTASSLYERLALSRNKKEVIRLANEGQTVEKPTVGILLCETANKTLVELALSENANIYAAQYALYLPDKKLLRQKLKEWTKEFGNFKGAEK